MNLLEEKFLNPSIPKNNIFDLTPEMELYHIKIKVLGLRNLKSLGLIPVKRAFLRFDINSVRSPSQKQALIEKKYIQTLPSEPGNNPNILTILDFSVNLPKDYHICPHLNVIFQFNSLLDTIFL